MQFKTRTARACNARYKNEMQLGTPKGLKHKEMGMPFRKRKCK